MPARPEYLPFGRPSFSEEEVQAIGRVIHSGWIGMGPETLDFEQELASTLGVPHVVTVNSCTSALFLALLTHGVGPGDEVICPSLTWCSTANAARYLGAQPVFCDVDPDTLCASPATVQAALTARTKAAIIVHYGGLAVDVEAIRRGLPPGISLIEDAAHAFGARFRDGSWVGASGHDTCFSFYANKNLSTGEGGAIALRDPARAERLRSLRQHGLPQDAWRRFIDARRFAAGQPLELGYKMNYTDLQAALGRVQLRKQPGFRERRRAIAAYYADEIARRLPAWSIQADVTHPDHARHLFVVRLPAGLNRDVLLRRLRDDNIGASLHYSPLHLMNLYASGVALPATEEVAPRLLTLPISASMALEDARDVITALTAAADFTSTEFAPRVSV